MKDYGARLVLDTRRFSAGVNTSVRMLSNMSRSVNNTKKQMRELEKIKVKADAKQFESTIRKVTALMKPIRKGVVNSIATKDLASEKIRLTTRKLQGLNNKVFSPVVKLKDNVTGSINSITQKLFTLKNAVITTAIVGGAGIAGKQVMGEVGSSQTAQGEVASLGIGKGGLEKITRQAIQFSNTWSGTTRSEFISASYDIKSGIASLTDEGVAKFTELSALTGKATKSTTGEMTNLFAQAYGIYRENFSSDFDFGNKFASGLAKSVQLFRTTGGEMSGYLTTLGSNAQMAGAELSEVYAVGGMLQNVMSGSEAGTKYRAFLEGAYDASGKLGLKFVDNNNKLLESAKIVEMIRKKYGDQLDAIESNQLKEAFGREEATAFIKYFYNKTSDLKKVQDDLNVSMGKGTQTIEEMANAMNVGLLQRLDVAKQRIDNIKYGFGLKLDPAVGAVLDKFNAKLLNLEKSKAFNSFADVVAGGIIGGIQQIEKFMDYLENNPQKIADAWKTAVSIFQVVGSVISTLYTIAKPFLDYIRDNPKQVANMVIAFGALYGGFLLISKGISAVAGIATFINNLKFIWSLISIIAPIIGGALMSAISSFATGAIAVLSPLWAFLLANPIILIIMVIIGAIALLYKAWKGNWFGIRDITKSAMSGIASFVTGLWGSILGFVEGKINGFIGLVNKLIDVINLLPNVDIDKFSGVNLTGKNSKEAFKNARPYASGLSRVPYDNFPAILHEGEEVRTASKVRSEKGSVTIAKLADQIIVREEADIDKIATKLVKRIKEERFNMA